jgi:hypothetical protein
LLPDLVRAYLERVVAGGVFLVVLDRHLVLTGLRRLARAHVQVSRVRVGCGFRFHIAIPGQTGSSQDERVRMREHAQPSVPSLLVGIRQGDADALGQLFQLVYDELHALARIQRRRRPDSETLNTTALLHEAFIKLARADGLDLHDRAHFMAVAATAMRHVLLSDARRRTAAKRGPGKAYLLRGGRARSGEWSRIGRSERGDPPCVG